jgi:hypothetical protein
MQRDFDYENDDVFGVLISPFNDGRNGYLFIINPNAARADLQVSWENDNIDWNGVGMQKQFVMTADGLLRYRSHSTHCNSERTVPKYGLSTSAGRSVTRMRKIAGKDGVVITASKI